MPYLWSYLCPRSLSHLTPTHPLSPRHICALPKMSSHVCITVHFEGELHTCMYCRRLNLGEQSLSQQTLEIIIIINVITNPLHDEGSFQHSPPLSDVNVLHTVSEHAPNLTLHLILWLSSPLTFSQLPFCYSYNLFIMSHVHIICLSLFLIISYHKKLL